MAQERDRSLAGVVHVCDGPSLRLRPDGRLDAHAVSAELGGGAAAQLIVAQRGEQRALARERGEDDRGHPSPTRRLGPGVDRVHDLTGRR